MESVGFISMGGYSRSVTLTREALSNQIADDLATRNTNAGLIESAVNDADGRIGVNESDIATLESDLGDAEIAIDTLNADDTTEGSVAKTVKDAVEPIESRLDSTKLTLARQGQDLASVKQTLQQGNGATLDFEDIGIVPLDARATGRANPTVKGRTATNSFQISPLVTSTEGGITYTKVDNFTWNINGTASGESTKSICPNKNFIDGHVYYFNRYTNCDGQLSIQAYGMFSQTLDLDVVFTAVIGVYSTIYVTHSASAVINNVTIKPLLIDLTQTFGAGNEPSKADCAKIFSYFDGTKSIQLPARVRSVSEDESETSTLYIADNEEVRSFGATTDLVKVVNGEFVLEKNVNDDATAVISPPIITPLTTSSTLKAFQNGTVYFEPYYEGSHQTDASSQITLPYEGTIDKVYGYDEGLVEYLLDSSEYSLAGTTLTITGAEENEVYYVELSRAEPLSPEMSVNVLNNDRVLLNPTNGKFYDYTIGVSGADGALIPEFIFTEVE